MPAWALRLVSELQAAGRRAEAVAQPLTPKQLNWQPSAGAWSIGQCLEHLLLANQGYLPAISASLDGRQPGLAEEIRLGLITRWFIANYVAPNSKGVRARAPGKIQPAGNSDPAIVASFLRSNRDVHELIRRAGEYDVNRIRFRNPFIGALRFTVGAGLEIIVNHQRRHLLQAEGVRQSAAFPGVTSE